MNSLLVCVCVCVASKCHVLDNWSKARLDHDLNKDFCYTLNKITFYYEMINSIFSASLDTVNRNGGVYEE